MADPTTITTGQPITIITDEPPSRVDDPITTAQTGQPVSYSVGLDGADDDDGGGGDPDPEPEPEVELPAGVYGDYSVTRKLRADYAGSAFQVRRSNDDATLDIGFVGTDVGSPVNNAAVLAFCGANNGFVSNLYDQGGSSRTMSQGTTTRQPKIYDGSAMLTRNGFNVMQFDGSNDYLQTIVDTGFTGAATWFVVCSIHTHTDGKIIASGRKSNDFFMLEMKSPTTQARTYASAQQVGGLDFGPLDALQLITSVIGTTGWLQKNNGTPGGTSPGQTLTAAQGAVLGGHPGDFGFSNCEVSEFRVWNSSLEYDPRQIVKDDINGFYSFWS